jgi:hypothetical protein
MSAAAVTGGEETARRRRVRRFGFGLLLVVVLLLGATVGYVELFGHVLRDPNLPPTVTSSANPRVLLFEILLAAALLVGLTAFVVVIRRRSSP